MKERNGMYPAECCTLPCIASPCRGLSSLSVFVPDRWQAQNLQSTLSAFAPRRGVEPNFAKKSEPDFDREKTELDLPKDPRLWSREDVANWVQHVVDAHRLPSVQLDRFLMNGKALCLMTMDMFVNRVPLGGKLLYKDFQLRLSSALYS